MVEVNNPDITEKRIDEIADLLVLMKEKMDLVSTKFDEPRIRKRLEDKTREKAFREFMQFAQLECINYEEKRSMLTTITLSLLCASAIEAWSERLFDRVLSYYLLPAIGVFVTSPIVIQSYYAFSFTGPFFWGMFGVAYLISLTLCLLLLVVPLFLEDLIPVGKLPTDVVTRGWFVSILTAFALCGYLVAQASEGVSGYSFAIVSALHALPAAALLVAVITLAQWLLVGFAIREWQRRTPAYGILVVILRLLNRVEQEIDKPLVIHEKNALADRIEELARRIGQFSKTHDPGDAATKRWLSRDFELIAHSVRQLKRYVYDGTRDSREVLQKKLVALFRATYLSDFQHVERVAEEEMEYKADRKSLVIVVIRTVFIASAPLLVLGVLQQSTLALPSNISAYITAGGVVWAFLSVLSAIDSDLPVKIGLIKHLIPGRASQSD